MDKAITGLMVLAGGAIAYTLWNRDGQPDAPGDAAEPHGQNAEVDSADISEVLQRIDDEARFGRGRREYRRAGARRARIAHVRRGAVR